jgi:UDP-sulfoquinovose synthase
VENPRVEDEEHYYNARHTALLDLGLKPRYLSETLIESMFARIEQHKNRVITQAIMPKTRWRPERVAAAAE